MNKSIISVFGTILFVISIICNIQQHTEISRLKYKLQKIEAGQWKGLFDSKPIFPRPDKKPLDKTKTPNTIDGCITKLIWGRIDSTGYQKLYLASRS